jgi:hypothetical protein
MTEEKHMWAGKEQPAHIDNIKEWQLTCGDFVENILLQTVKDICIMVYGGVPPQTKDNLWPVVKEVMPVLIEKMRENDIPVWNPEADSYEF